MGTFPALTISRFYPEGWTAQQPSVLDKPRLRRVVFRVLWWFSTILEREKVSCADLFNWSGIQELYSVSSEPVPSEGEAVQSEAEF